jgi:hypothetical protein
VATSAAAAAAQCYCKAVDVPHAARYHCSKCQEDLCEAMMLVHQKHGGTLVPVAGPPALSASEEGSGRAQASSIELTDF